MCKTILCYGDSNTWGYYADEDRRFLWNQRWTGILQSNLGAEWHVVEDGLCGRTTTAVNHLRQEDEFLKSNLSLSTNVNGPLDVLIVMLGTNDVKEEYQLEVNMICKALEEEIIQACEISRMISGTNKAPKILLLAPPEIVDIENSPFFEEFGTSSEVKSKEFGLAYEELAKHMEWEFLNIGDVVKPGVYDGVHLDLDGERKVADAIYNKLQG